MAIGLHAAQLRLHRTGRERREALRAALRNRRLHDEPPSRRSQRGSNEAGRCPGLDFFLTKIGAVLEINLSTRLLGAMGISLHGPDAAAAPQAAPTLPAPGAGRASALPAPSWTPMHTRLCSRSPAVSSEEVITSPLKIIRAHISPSYEEMLSIAPLHSHACIQFVSLFAMEGDSDVLDGCLAQLMPNAENN